MFKKLRTHFILINLLSTSLILITAFSIIYFVARNSSLEHRPISGQPPEFETFLENADTDEQSQLAPIFNNYLEERILADRKASLNQLLFTLIITGISFEIVIVIFSYLFAEQSIRPVREAYESQKIFIANASHEIKTPVAAIKANLEAADLSSQNHWIKNVELEADKIERLNLSLLKLAQTDAITTKPPVKDVKLKTATTKIIDSFASRLRKRKLKTNFQLSSDFTTKLCLDDYQELLGILIDNAIKYSKSSIAITLTPKSFTIKNDGATIPADKLPHVFDRFYQVDKTSKGSGLGLAIAASLASRNHWHLTANSTKNFTEFTLSF
ncbi:HAMP domain-containing histidine kinase [Candidatus Saccharibacteria bacterium]|nr:HAMP domain-containing histidine kinase [Candidatus Saccharibacteria bacterium]